MKYFVTNGIIRGYLLEERIKKPAHEFYWKLIQNQVNLGEMDIQELRNLIVEASELISPKKGAVRIGGILNGELNHFLQEEKVEFFSIFLAGKLDDIIIVERPICYI